MIANTISVYPKFSRATLQVADGEFFAVQTRGTNDLSVSDRVSGQLELGKLNWLLNLTQHKLIYAQVLGRFSTVYSAQCASLAGDDAEALDLSLGAVTSLVAWRNCRAQAELAVGWRSGKNRAEMSALSAAPGASEQTELLKAVRAGPSAPSAPQRGERLHKL